MNGTDEEVLVILDDVSILEWIGFEAQDVGRFCRAVRVLCLKVLAHSSTTLVLLVDALPTETRNALHPTPHHHPRRSYK